MKRRLLLRFLCWALAALTVPTARGGTDTVRKGATTTLTPEAQDTAAQRRQNLVPAENHLILARVNLANAPSLPNPERLALAEPAGDPTGTATMAVQIARAMDRREDLRVDALHLGIADEAHETTTAAT